MNRITKFLNGNTAIDGGLLPLVHSTRAYHIRSLMNANRIQATKCDVFTKDRLTYFFVGRPAYKYTLTENAEFWEFPVCFILDYGAIPNVKRIFPFDSGGFAKRLLPSYMHMMNLDDFELSECSNAVGKVIGTFFGSSRNYFDFRGRKDQDFSQAHSLSPLDAEVLGLHRLSLSGSTKSFDDRNLTIEIQSDQDVPLAPGKVLAVIAPIVYFDDATFLDHVEKVWGAQALSYQLYPINPAYHYAAIYDRVAHFYQKMGLFTG